MRGDRDLIEAQQWEAINSEQTVAMAKIEFYVISLIFILKIKLPSNLIISVEKYSKIFFNKKNISFIIAYWILMNKIIIYLNNNKILVKNRKIYKDNILFIMKLIGKFWIIFTYLWKLFLKVIKPIYL